MFRDIAYADRSGERWLEVDDWSDLGPERRAWQGAQIWTRSSIYQLDHALRCVSVTDRDTREAQPGHPLVGQHLVGAFSPGHRMVLEEDLPSVGQAAVFSRLSRRPATLRRTSRVERIRLLMRPAPVERLSEPFITAAMVPSS